MSGLETTVQNIMKCCLWFKTACGHERFTVSFVKAMQKCLFIKVTESLPLATQ